MSDDFKKVLRILAPVAIVVFLAGFGWMFFLQPYFNYEQQLTVANKNLLNKMQQMRKVQKQIAELERFRLTSLPVDRDITKEQRKPKEEYRRYLSELLTRSRFKVDTNGMTTSISSSVPFGMNRNRFGAKKEKPVYQKVQVKLSGYAKLEDLVVFLRLFRRAPVLHRIARINMEPADRKKMGSNYLHVSMSIEALIVAGATKRQQSLTGVDDRLVMVDAVIAMQGGPAGLALVPWAAGPTGPVGKQKLAMLDSQRQYRTISEKSIFEGFKPPIIKDEGPPDPGPDMARYTYLSYIKMSDIRGEAWLYNRLTQHEIRLRVSRIFGKFKILAEDGETVQLEGNVVKIDSRNVYFQLLNEIEYRGAVFRLESGKNLLDAIRSPLSAEEVAKLGISPEDLQQ